MQHFILRRGGGADKGGILVVVRLAAVPPVNIWDVAIDYDSVEEVFYARDDTDRRVFLSETQAIYVNPTNGERKIIRKED